MIPMKSYKDSYQSIKQIQSQIPPTKLQFKPNKTFMGSKHCNKKDISRHKPHLLKICRYWS